MSVLRYHGVLCLAWDNAGDVGCLRIGFFYRCLYSRNRANILAFQQRSVHYTDAMNPEKKRINVMIYDRYTEAVIDFAALLNITPNEVVNRMVDGCLQQYDQRTKPVDPIPVVDVARSAARRNLTIPDRILQNLLDAYVPNWRREAERWREHFVALCAASNEPLTKKVVVELKKEADKLVRDDRKNLKSLRDQDSAS